MKLRREDLPAAAFSRRQFIRAIGAGFVASSVANGLGAGAAHAGPQALTSLGVRVDTFGRRFVLREDRPSSISEMER
jgi:hypothetical protein